MCFDSGYMFGVFKCLRKLGVLENFLKSLDMCLECLSV